jgi:GxxExxY protein
MTAKDKRLGAKAELTAKGYDMVADGKHSELTEAVIGAAYTVHNTLGHGFAEKVYENALCAELEMLGMPAVQQVAIEVGSKGRIVGQYTADIVVDGKLIVEVKAVSELAKEHEVQLVNYLKATGIEVGLLVNFGNKVQVRRRAFS